MIEDENFRSFLLRLGEKGRPKDKTGDYRQIPFDLMLFLSFFILYSRFFPREDCLFTMIERLSTMLWPYLASWTLDWNRNSAA